MSRNVQRGLEREVKRGSTYSRIEGGSQVSRLWVILDIIYGSYNVMGKDVQVLLKASWNVALS